MNKGKTNIKRADKLLTPWLAFQIESETGYLIKVLNEQNFNMMRTAKFLGLQRSHLYNLIKKYKIVKPGTGTQEEEDHRNFLQGQVMTPTARP